MNSCKGTKNAKRKNCDAPSTLLLLPFAFHLSPSFLCVFAALREIFSASSFCAFRPFSLPSLSARVPIVLVLVVILVLEGLKALLRFKTLRSLRRGPAVS